MTCFLHGAFILGSIVVLLLTFLFSLCHSFDNPGYFGKSVYFARVVLAAILFAAFYAASYIIGAGICHTR